MNKPKLSAQIKVVPEDSSPYDYEWAGWSNVGTSYDLKDLPHAVQKIMDDPNAEDGWMIIDGDNNTAYVSDAKFAQDAVRRGVINFNSKIETIKIGLFDIVQSQPVAQSPNTQALEKLKILTRFMYESRGTGVTTVQLLGVDDDYECIIVHKGQAERHYMTGILGKETKRVKFIDINQLPERIEQVLRGRKCPLIIDHGTWIDLVIELFHLNEALEHQVNQLKKQK